MRGLRFLYVISGAVAVNLVMFLLMEQMITRVRTEPVLRVLSMVDFVRLKHEPPPPEVKERLEPPKPQQQETLPRPDMLTTTLRQPIVHELSAPLPRMSVPLNIRGGPYIDQMTRGAGIGEFREPVPLVRIPPLYPPNAQARRIEGVVRVEFVVDANGSVTQPFVVYSEPPGLFDRAILSAIRNWKFETKVVDGKPVPWRTAQTVRFKMVN